MDNKFLYNNKSLKDRRKELRNNQTKAELLLWQKLRRSRITGYKFVRQYSVGPYILDFYCPKLRLGIELDGDYHNDPEAILYDKDRENYLKSVNIKIIRFWNSEVLQNITSVVQKITAVATQLASPLTIRGD